MRNCNFMVVESIAVRRALVDQAWSDYRAGVDVLEDTLDDIAIIRKRDHKSRLIMLKQRGIPYPKVNYSGCA